jgi:glycosyltransferase involved in cell wall biosynthesis
VRSPAPILFLARGGALDGQQQQVLQLASALPALGRSAVVAVDDPGALLDELGRRGIAAGHFPMRSWRSLTRYLPAWFDAFRLLSLARRRGVGLVHAHDHWREPYARFVARRLSIPYVVHIRGPISVDHARKYRLAEAGAVIAIARRYVDSLLAAGVRAERIHVVSDSVDLARFDPARTAAARGDPNRPATVAIVGRIDPFKRITEFVDIVAALPRALRDATRFLVVGDEFQHDYAEAVRERIRRNGLAGQIEFTGRVEPERMPALLAGVDVLVTLSGGSVMFEAMAMETAVLSIRDDGSHSQFTIDGETAVCVDATKAAAALAELIASPEKRRTLGSAGRALVERELSTGRIAAETDAVYRSLLER